MAFLNTFTQNMDRSDMGGMAKLYILDDTVAALGADAAAVEGGSVAVAQMTGSLVWSEVSLIKQTANFTEVATVSTENGSLFYEGTLNFTIAQHDSGSTQFLHSLAKNNSDVVLAYEDNDGNRFLIGALKGAELSAGSAMTGTAFGDKKGLDITITSREKFPSPQLAADAWADIIA